jgi:hypothetical protein
LSTRVVLDIYFKDEVPIFLNGGIYNLVNFQNARNSF